jgi:hypothetical protein
MFGARPHCFMQSQMIVAPLRNLVLNNHYIGLLYIPTLNDSQ